jgi:cation diffusion facilitator family transporter
LRSRSYRNGEISHKSLETDEREARVAARGTETVVTAALAAAAAVAILTLAAAAWTGPSALLAVGIQALVAASSLALIRVGQRRAERPADAAHPFGYGKEIAFWSFVVAILLYALGAGAAMHEGIVAVADPRPVAGWTYMLAVLAAALVPLLYAAAQAGAEVRRRSGSGPTLIALRDLNDPALASALIQTFAGVAGLAVAAAGLGLSYLTGSEAIDGGGAVLIGLLLAAVAAFLSIEVRALVIGEAASPAVIHDVRAAIAAERGLGRPIGAINEIRTLQLGANDILVVASVDFEDRTTAAGIEAATSRIEQAIKARHPAVRRFYMEGQSAREHTRAERASAEAGPAGPACQTAPATKPAIEIPASSAEPAAPTPAPVAPHAAPPVASPVFRDAATPASPASTPVAAKPAAPAPTLPARESRKGRKRQKGKRH